MGDDIVTIAEFIASEVGFYSPGMVVQAQDLIAWLLERGFAVVAADEIERLRAAGDALAAAVNAVACSGTQDEMTELTDAFLDWEARRV